eukprot:TRINITY_DN73094_c0_g1_i1.p1 TRINITY_DN73094_c0_g1~~TRINITY_DN73094_c0_g1_i1.p1  ORF type:complete len:148 (+),score=25.42 TRINITY_DN73094_c0_g1_i1:30-473(+)
MASALRLLRLNFSQLQPLRRSHLAEKALVLAAPPWAKLGAVRSAHKFACPPSPNLEALRKILTERLVPVHFFIRNNLTFTNYVWDKHFIGIICSPKFEGKTHKEINQMVDDICDEVGMKGRVRLMAQPPSRWHMMKRRTRRRWDFDR